MNSESAFQLFRRKVDVLSNPSGTTGPEEIVETANALLRFRRCGLDDRNVLSFVGLLVKYIEALLKYTQKFPDSDRYFYEISYSINIILNVGNAFGLQIHLLKSFKEFTRIITTKYPNAPGIKEFLKLYSLWMDRVEPATVNRIANKHYKTYLSLYSLVNQSSDIELQTATMISLVRLFKDDISHSYLKRKLFNNDRRLSTAFEKLHAAAEGGIFLGTRRFLNVLNENSNSVFSIQCQSIMLDRLKLVDLASSENSQSPIWLDFDLNRRRISCFCDKICQTHLSTQLLFYTEWLLLSFHARDVLKVNFAYADDTATAEIALSIKSSDVNMFSQWEFPRIVTFKVEISESTRNFGRLVSAVLPNFFPSVFHSTSPILSQTEEPLTRYFDKQDGSSDITLTNIDRSKSSMSLMTPPSDTDPAIEAQVEQFQELNGELLSTSRKISSVRELPSAPFLEAYSPAGSLSVLSLDQSVAVISSDDDDGDGGDNVDTKGETLRNNTLTAENQERITSKLSGNKIVRYKDEPVAVISSDDEDNGETVRDIPAEHRRRITGILSGSNKIARYKSIASTEESPCPTFTSPCTPPPPPQCEVIAPLREENNEIIEVFNSESEREKQEQNAKIRNAAGRLSSFVRTVSRSITPLSFTSSIVGRKRSAIPITSDDEEDHCHRQHPDENSRTESIQDLEQNNNNENNDDIVVPALKVSHSYGKTNIETELKSVQKISKHYSKSSDRQYNNKVSILKVGGLERNISTKAIKEAENEATVLQVEENVPESASSHQVHENPIQRVPSPEVAATPEDDSVRSKVEMWLENQPLEENLPHLLDANNRSISSSSEARQIIEMAKMSQCKGNREASNKISQQCMTTKTSIEENHAKDNEEEEVVVQKERESIDRKKHDLIKAPLRTYCNNKRHPKNKLLLDGIGKVNVELATAATNYIKRKMSKNIDLDPDLSTHQQHPDDIITDIDSGSPLTKNRAQTTRALSNTSSSPDQTLITSPQSETIPLSELASKLKKTTVEMPEAQIFDSPEQDTETLKLAAKNSKPVVILHELLPPADVNGNSVAVQDLNSTTTGSLQQEFLHESASSHKERSVDGERKNNSVAVQDLNSSTTGSSHQEFLHESPSRHKERSVNGERKNDSVAVQDLNSSTTGSLHQEFLRPDESPSRHKDKSVDGESCSGSSRKSSLTLPKLYPISQLYRRRKLQQREREARKKGICARIDLTLSDDEGESVNSSMTTDSRIEPSNEENRRKDGGIAPKDATAQQFSPNSSIQNLLDKVEETLLWPAQSNKKISKMKSVEENSSLGTTGAIEEPENVASKNSLSKSSTVDSSNDDNKEKAGTVGAIKEVGNVGGIVTGTSSISFGDVISDDDWSSNHNDAALGVSSLDEPLGSNINTTCSQSQSSHENQEIVPEKCGGMADEVETTRKIQKSDKLVNRGSEEIIQHSSDPGNDNKTSARTTLDTNNSLLVCESSANQSVEEQVETMFKDVDTLQTSRQSLLTPLQTQEVLDVLQSNAASQNNKEMLKKNNKKDSSPIIISEEQSKKSQSDVINRRPQEPPKVPSPPRMKTIIGRNSGKIVKLGHILQGSLTRPKAQQPQPIILEPIAEEKNEEPPETLLSPPQNKTPDQINIKIPKTDNLLQNKSPLHQKSQCKPSIIMADPVAERPRVNIIEDNNLAPSTNQSSSISSVKTDDDEVFDALFAVGKSKHDLIDKCTKKRKPTEFQPHQFDHNNNNNSDGNGPAKRKKAAFHDSTNTARENPVTVSTKKYLALSGSNKTTQLNSDECNNNYNKELKTKKQKPKKESPLKNKNKKPAAVINKASKSADDTQTSKSTTKRQLYNPDDMSHLEMSIEEEFDRTFVPDQVETNKPKPKSNKRKEEMTRAAPKKLNVKVNNKKRGKAAEDDLMRMFARRHERSKKVAAAATTLSEVPPAAEKINSTSLLFRQAVKEMRGSSQSSMESFGTAAAQTFSISVSTKKLPEKSTKTIASRYFNGKNNNSNIEKINNNNNNNRKVNRNPLSPAVTKKIKILEDIVLQPANQPSLITSSEDEDELISKPKWSRQAKALRFALRTAVEIYDCLRTDYPTEIIPEVESIAGAIDIIKKVYKA